MGLWLCIGEYEIGLWLCVGESEMGLYLCIGECKMGLWLCIGECEMGLWLRHLSVVLHVIPPSAYPIVYALIKDVGRPHTNDHFFSGGLGGILQ